MEADLEEQAFVKGLRRDIDFHIMRDNMGIPFMIFFRILWSRIKDNF